MASGILGLFLAILTLPMTGIGYGIYDNKKEISMNRAVLHFIIRVAWSDNVIKSQELNLISFFASKGNFGVKVDSDYIERMNKEPIQWSLLAKNTDSVKSKLYRTAFLTAISYG